MLVYAIVSLVLLLPLLYLVYGLVIVGSEFSKNQQDIATAMAITWGILSFFSTPIIMWWFTE